jgi:Flp pilus assembly protein TadG
MGMTKNSTRAARRAERAKQRRFGRDEASNSFALFVVMLPMLLGAFGMGLDISRNVYIRTELQNALDLAVVGGAAEVRHDDAGNIYVDQARAVAAAERIYDANRQQAARLECTSNHTIEGTGTRRCWQRWNEPVASGGEFTYSVVEISKNAFLPVVGVTFQTYRLVSHASLRQDAQ